MCSTFRSSALVAFIVCVSALGNEPGNLMRTGIKARSMHGAPASAPFKAIAHSKGLIRSRRTSAHSTATVEMSGFGRMELQSGLQEDAESRARNMSVFPEANNEIQMPNQMASMAKGRIGKFISFRNSKPDSRRQSSLFRHAMSDANIAQSLQLPLKPRTKHARKVAVEAVTHVPANASLPVSLVVSTGSKKVKVAWGMITLHVGAIALGLSVGFLWGHALGKRSHMHEDSQLPDTSSMPYSHRMSMTRATSSGSHMKGSPSAHRHDLPSMSRSSSVEYLRSALKKQDGRFAHASTLDANI